MNKQHSATLTLLRLPLIWGGIAAACFYLLIHQGILAGPFVERYFASHPVEYIAMTLFFVGLAALLAKWIEVSAQFDDLKKISLGDAPPGGEEVDSAGSVFEKLEELPRRAKASYLARRLREAVGYVQKKGSADELDEQIRYLSDVDVARMHSSYSLVRIIVWAIPILGFLGTVIGITLAIAKLLPEDLEKSLPEVVSGLQVAFDTTALALGLSIVLMFAQFLVIRQETQLLEVVDQRTSQELVGRFRQYGAAKDPQVAAIRRMSESVIGASEKLVSRQAEVWKQTIEAAHQRWSHLTGAAAHQIEDSLKSALTETLDRHAQTVAEATSKSAEQNRKHWGEVQQALVESAKAVAKQQEELVNHGDVLLKVVDATGQVRKLEQALNENLNALAGARHFDEAVTSMSAAVHLLSSRLGGSSESRVAIDSKSPSQHAA